MKTAAARKVGVVAIALCMAAPTHAQPANPTTSAAATATAGAIREIGWKDLVPVDWKAPRLPLRAIILGDASAEAQDALAQLRVAWDAAPTVDGLNGALVSLAGYVVPLEEVQGNLKEFLLVPYFGACIHTPPPPANQIVLVRTRAPVKGFRAMDTVRVSGTLTTARQDSTMGASGYRLDAIAVDSFVAPPSR